MNTKSVLVQVPTDIATDSVQMSISYFINVPFSYQPPQLIDELSLQRHATRHGFRFDSSNTVDGKKYLLFIKSDFTLDDMPSSLDDMKKYHNIEKKSLILQYAKQKTVLDLGAGYGGDLFKYHEAKSKRLILVEPSISNMVTLKGRLDNMMEYPIYKQITLIHAKGQEFDKIRPFLTKRVEVVSSFFSLTFLFESRQILGAFLDTVVQSLLEGGYFIGTMMEGLKTYQLLDKIEPNGLLRLGEIEMTKQYENKEPDVGMKVKIHINQSIVTEQTEYLAFFSILEEELKARHCVLVKKIDFNPPDKIVSLDQKTFSALNVSFVFRYLPEQVSYTIERAQPNETFECINLYKETQLLIRTGVPTEYSFAHSFLYNSSNEYRISSPIRRDEMAKSIGLISLEQIPVFIKEKNVNIYVKDTLKRKPMKMDGYEVSRKTSILLLMFPDGSFEPMAVNLHGVAIRSFPPFDPFISNIHRNMKK